tara:strand:- start:550 stop:2070 length:1521 start_codon:yes stop_codon:yes gene_type:complete
MAYTQFDEELQRKLAGIFPQSSNVVDVTDVARTFPTADVSGFPQRLSPADVLTLISYTSDPQAEGRANAFRSLVKRPGTYRRSAPTGLQASLNSIAGTTDDEIQAAALKTLREAINSGDLPLGNMAAFNQWAVTLPHHFIKDVRQAYTNMSTQVRQEGVSQRQAEKHPGEMTLQEQQIAAGEHAEELWPGEKIIQGQTIGKGNERTIKIGNDFVNQTRKDANSPWVTDSRAPRWDADTTKQQDFRFYVEQVNEARKIEGKEPLTDREEADIFNKYFLKEQVETREAYTPSMVSDLGTKKVSFLNSRDISLNMLNLLGRSEVLTGGVQSFFGGLANISGQVKMMANLFREDDLINKAELYTWDKPELGDVLKANLLDLAYSLARSFEDEGGRLSKEDVQLQIDKLSAGMQSKTRMAAVLYDTHNRSLGRLKNQYLTAKDAGTPGTERSWEEYMAFIGTGTLLTRTRGDETGVGYWVDVIGPDGKAVVGEDGKRKREFIVFAKWAAGS